MHTLPRLVAAAVLCGLCGFAGGTAAMSLASEPEQGPAGPPGPAGERGALGPMGPAGQDAEVSDLQLQLDVLQTRIEELEGDLSSRTDDLCAIVERVVTGVTVNPVVDGQLLVDTTPFPVCLNPPG